MKTLFLILPFLLPATFFLNQKEDVISKVSFGYATPEVDENYVLVGCSTGTCTCNLNLTIAEVDAPNGFTVNLHKRTGTTTSTICASFTQAGTYDITLDGGQGGSLPQNGYAPYFISVSFNLPSGNESLVVSLSECVSGSRTFTIFSSNWDIVPGNLCD